MSRLPVKSTTGDFKVGRIFSAVMSIAVWPMHKETKIVLVEGHTGTGEQGMVVVGVMGGGGSQSTVVVNWRSAVRTWVATGT